MRVTNILLLEQHSMPDHAHPPPHKHTHTPTKRTLSAWRPLPIPPPVHTTLFPIPITTNAQVFLSHNCPKRKENLIHKSWNFTEFNCTYIQQGQEIVTNSRHNMNELAPRALLLKNMFRQFFCHLHRHYFLKFVKYLLLSTPFGKLVRFLSGPFMFCNII